ncbi:hypothetical protein [Priestia megaterium]|uniref:hypothetical protein n=1 Tax=Priestia megaterium TaxID=1404 RepID=UPI002448A5A5|nr:hypothetical protein [Priestia megaterium]MDH2363430.1 hypothetical protein [Priestia megaterium]
MEKHNLYSWFKSQSLSAKSLLLLFLISLIAAFVTFQIADKIHGNFYIEQDDMINKTKGIIESKKVLTKKESQKVRRMIQAHQNNYHSYQYLALYAKNKKQTDRYQYDSILADSNLNKAQYVFPVNGEIKRGILADSFYVSEVLNVGDWYIVQQYDGTGGYYYEITTLLFGISGMSLIIYLIIEGRRYLKLGIRTPRHA